MNIQLPTGKTMSISVYEYYFKVKEDEVDLFYQECIAADYGEQVNNPFSQRIVAGKLEIEDEDTLEDANPKE